MARSRGGAIQPGPRQPGPQVMHSTSHTGRTHDCFPLFGSRKDNGVDHLRRSLPVRVGPRFRCRNNRSTPTWIRCCRPIGELLGANVFVMTQVWLRTLSPVPPEKWRFDVRAKVYSSLYDTETVFYSVKDVTFPEAVEQIDKQKAEILQKLLELIRPTDGLGKRTPLTDGPVTARACCTLSTQLQGCARIAEAVKARRR